MTILKKKDVEEEPPPDIVLLPLDRFMDIEGLSHVVLFLKQWNNSSLVLLHIIRLPMSSPLDEEIFTDEIELAREWLKPLENWCLEQGFRTRLKIRLARNIADRILDEIDRHPYRFILIPRRPKQNFWRKLRKTTSQRVIEESGIPVVVFPPRSS